MLGSGNDLSVAQSAFASVERPDGSLVAPQGVKLDLSALDPANLLCGGHFVVECYDSEGNLRWEDTAENMVTAAGIAYILGVSVYTTTQITAWYIGLIDNAGFTALNAADTMSSHSGWSEVAGANFSNSSRPQWTSGAPSGGAVTNASTVNYNMTPSSTDTIYGLFIVSDSTKAGTTGTLLSTAAFSGGTQATNNGDTLKITYTLSATSS